MTDPKDLERLVARLEAVEKDHGQDLTAAERQQLREMIAAWRVWVSMGVVGKALIWTLLTFAGLVVAWQQIKEAFKL